MYDYTSQVAIQNKTIKRKQQTQPEPALVLAGFYQGYSILLVYENGGIVRVTNKEEIKNGRHKLEEEETKELSQGSLAHKLK